MFHRYPAMVFTAFLRKILLIFCLVTLAGNTNAQEIGRSKKAISAFDRARKAFFARNYASALAELKTAVSEDSTYAEAFLLLGDLKSETNRPTEAVVAYKRAIAADSSFYPSTYYIIANIQFELGKYEDAHNYYGKYLRLLIPDQAKTAYATKNRLLCLFRIEAIKHPVPFKPENMGDSINTDGFEYINAQSIDGRQLYFTRRSPSHRGDESFFFSIRKNAGWGLAQNLGPPVNTPGDEGALCLSPDGSQLFFAACSRNDSYGSCDIYISKRNGNKWSEPRNAGPIVNSAQWDSQPALASDGRTLYFASKRPGGKGNSDIWKSVLQTDGKWGIPENMGDSINTPDAEMTPFIHPDGNTLYFASKGHPGMGGADLFVSRADANGKWSKAANLGYPLNTAADDISLVVSASGDTAYLSSDNYGGKGKADIYSFLLPLSAKPNPVSYVKGIVTDAKTKSRLQATFELSDLSTGAVVVRSLSDALTGEFLLSLPTGKEYALNVSQKGYMFYSMHFSVGQGKDRFKPEIITVELQPFALGKTMILHNIFFDTDQHTLRQESKVELDKLLSFLQSNPNLKTEIGGHTDNEGSDEYNLQLSAARAKSVFDYLAVHGVAASRLTYHGYGETQPTATNASSEGRALNRRTEFKIIGQ
jgi:outer membrane protein OmpA-like peptidoglycan-associated protein